MNKEIKVSEEKLIEYEQSILRYDLMKRDLEKIQNGIGNDTGYKLAVSWANRLLRDLNELSDIVEDLKNNVPISLQIGKEFISDINNSWYYYENLKKKCSL